MTKKQETQTTHRQERPERKRAVICNICGYPKTIIIKELDEETSRMVEKKQIVNCLGHEYLHPSIWNMNSMKHSDASQQFLRSLTYDDYKKHSVRKHNQQEKKSK